MTSNRLFCSVTPPFHYNMKTIRSIQDLKGNTLTIEEHRSSSSTNDTPGLVLFTYSARPTTRPARVLLAGLRYVKSAACACRCCCAGGKSTGLLWIHIDCDVMGKGKCLCAFGRAAPGEWVVRLAGLFDCARCDAVSALPRYDNFFFGKIILNERMKC